MPTLDDLPLPSNTRRRLADAPLIVFDGECVLCSQLFRFVLIFDRRMAFRFVTAQSQIGQDLFVALGLPTVEFETFLVITHGRVYRKTAAVGAMLAQVGGPWRALAWIGALPPWSVDWAYDWVARRRYRLFGRRDTCLVPTPQTTSRFLT